MLLLFDAGNTRLKWALVDEAGEVAQSGAADYGSVDGLFEAMPASVGEILVSCVAGDQKKELITQACERVFQVKPSFASVSAHVCGIQNSYQTLETLGVDRWVAALGVRDIVGNRVIVDAGTAVTIDLVDASNRFRGGVILPGAKLMHSSLVGETAGIAAKHEAVNSVIGVTTQQCVNAGVNYGLIGAIEHIVEEMCKTAASDDSWRILVCGGDGKWLVDELKIGLPVTLDENLIFKGLLNMKNAGAL